MTAEKWSPASSTVDLMAWYVMITAPIRTAVAMHSTIIDWRPVRRTNPKITTCEADVTTNATAHNNNAQSQATILNTANFAVAAADEYKIISAVVDEATSGTIPSSIMIGPVIMPPPTPNIPATSPATAQPNGKYTTVFFVQWMSPSTY
ncbi:unnamed protein product [Phytophthora fragariaefolia]|uniref:Unnamed protein product n=1 Tax=Phytophthora fragariaefolia TaxID=1490495 RepID=A0A9W6U443_9STRA|nr:unnamed protein product [Phytophthora fragariaefolia]